MYQASPQSYISLNPCTLQEKEDTLRRRNMTEDERRMEDMMMGKHAGKDKAKIKFMQKYYHKGAFYMVSVAAACLTAHQQSTQQTVVMLLTVGTWRSAFSCVPAMVFSQ